MEMFAARPGVLLRGVSVLGWQHSALRHGYRFGRCSRTGGRGRVNGICCLEIETLARRPSRQRPRAARHDRARCGDAIVSSVSRRWPSRPSASPGARQTGQPSTEPEHRVPSSSTCARRPALFRCALLRLLYLQFLHTTNSPARRSSSANGREPAKRADIVPERQSGLQRRGGHDPPVPTTSGPTMPPSRCAFPGRLHAQDRAALSDRSRQGVRLRSLQVSLIRAALGRVGLAASGSEREQALLPQQDMARPVLVHVARHVGLGGHRGRVRLDDPGRPERAHHVDPSSRLSRTCGSPRPAPRSS